MAVTRAEVRGGKAGCWIADWYESEKRRERTFPTKREALDHLAEIRKSVRQFNQTSADANITVGEYADKWLTKVRSNSKERTVQNYSANLRLHILPTGATCASGTSIGAASPRGS